MPVKYYVVDIYSHGKGHFCTCPSVCPSSLSYIKVVELY